ncbi:MULTISPECIES: GOLPH3/VPS74 family protein [unclassified Streptomyces]|uniref:GOLPH3/VPS74 family protein n=1 Tax=unclassified Streptomyces TaxID=2593676 RepID=UPI0022580C26|nr:MULTISPECIES: GPP34 family phosphoprotein [unclassified Streptomyces]MCX5049858.1 GPP34 family phosphoprotein [Streptomyces sp. NBC_00474]
MTESLHHRMYLLAYDEEARGPYDRSRTGLLVRTAVLVELALRGRLVETGGGSVAVAGTGSTGDPVLDEMLREAPGHGWKQLVRRHSGRTLTAVEDQLAALGLLTVESSLLRLGGRRVTVSDPGTLRAVRDRVSAVLHGNAPVAGIPVADAALAALAAAGKNRSVVSRQDARELRDRIDACTGRLGTLAPGLEKTVRGLSMTMIAAQGGMGGG